MFGLNLILQQYRENLWAYVQTFFRKSQNNYNLQKTPTVKNYKIIVTLDAIQNKSAMEIDAAAREARRRKIKELEASLFGDGNNGDSLWNQR